jgi:hypothetical protein
LNPFTRNGIRGFLMLKNMAQSTELSAVTTQTTSVGVAVGQGYINIQVSTTGNREDLPPIYILFEDVEYEVMRPKNGPLSQTFPIAEGTVKLKALGTAGTPITAKLNYTAP